jgi:hypothetical protein
MSYSESGIVHKCEYTGLFTFTREHTPYYNLIVNKIKCKKMTWKEFVTKYPYFDNDVTIRSNIPVKQWKYKQ